MTGTEHLLLAFFLGLVFGKSVMYILLKIYYGRLLKDRRSNKRSRN